MKILKVIAETVSTSNEVRRERMYASPVTAVAHKYMPKSHATPKALTDRTNTTDSLKGSYFKHVVSVAMSNF